MRETLSHKLVSPGAGDTVVRIFVSIPLLLTKKDRFSICISPCCRSVSQAGGVYDDEWDRGDHDDDQRYSQDDRRHSQDDDDEVEVEEGEENLVIPTKPEYQPCAEDDDFLAALDKMVNENIAESKTIGEE